MGCPEGIPFINRLFLFLVAAVAIIFDHGPLHHPRFDWCQHLVPDGLLAGVGQWLDLTLGPGQTAPFAHP